jgi:ferredoxin
MLGKENQMSDQVYVQIAENVDKGFQTAPKSDAGELSRAFIAYLKLLYTPEEAEVVQHLFMFPVYKTMQELAEAAGKSTDDLQNILEPLIGKGFIIASSSGICIPTIPNLLNLHMFYPDVKPEDQEAARLYQQFFIKEKYYRYYGTSEKGTPFLRAIPIDRTIDPEEKTFTAEEAHQFIQDLPTEDFQLVPCPCRTRTEKLDIRECRDKFPIGNCIFIDGTARHFEKSGLGSRVTREQAIQYLDGMVEHGLIPTTQNYMAGKFGIMCLCCGCCCSNLRGRTVWDNPTAVLPSPFIPIAGDECVQCETCIDRCMLGALSLDAEEEKIVVDAEKCIGCGVCTIACATEALKLHRIDRPEKPFDTDVEMYMTLARDNNRL